MDSWNAKQLKCMQLGGNHGLAEFLSSYDLMSEPMDVRYQTKAAEYYRKKLKAFANEEEFNEEKPDYEEGRTVIEYKVKSAEEMKDSIGGNKAPKNADELWSYTKNTTMKGVNYAGQGFKTMGTKIKESGVTDKISTGAKTVGTKTVEYGGIAYSKTKEGINKIVTNEKVQEYSSKTYNGAKEVGKSVWGFFSNQYSKLSNKNGQADNGADAAQGNDVDLAGPVEPNAPTEPNIQNETN
jgi:hypothetical protein